MHTEVQVAPELHQRITDNATKLKAVVVEIIPPDTNLQPYDAFRESLTGNNAAIYKLAHEESDYHSKSRFHFAKQFNQTARELSQRCYCWANVKPIYTRQRQDCATFLSQANSFSNSWSSVIPWSAELKSSPTQHYVSFSKA
mmetsp:Transcript_15470/g.19869  ORF Transcript_15470/g.19869 Transcript_15470/m.19869 type:complete len:142 (-) Transcript_15470:32-457(-)